jgi:uncharacterized membrane protein
MNKNLVIVGVVFLVIGALMIPISQVPQVNTQKTYQQLKKMDNVDTQNISWRTWFEAGKEYRIELKNDYGNVIEIAPWNLVIKNDAGNKTYSDILYSDLKSVDDVGKKLAVFDDVRVDSDGFYDVEITGPHAYSSCWLLFLQATTTSETVYSHTFTIILVAIALIIVGAAIVALGRRHPRSQLVKPRSKPSHKTSP